MTGAWFKVGDRRYPLAELRNIRTVQGPRGDLTASAGVLAGVVAIVIDQVGERLGPDAWVGTVAVLMLLVAVAMLGNQLRRRTLLMLAEFRGLTVLLHVDDDYVRYQRTWCAVRQARRALHG